MSLAERVDDLYFRMCSRKIAYDTNLKASRAVIRMRHEYPGQNFCYYRCMFCGDFHVGHERTCKCCAH